MSERVKPDHIAQKDWDDVDIPELTDEDFERMRPAHEVLPEIFGAKTAERMLKRRGRPPKAATKEAINIRLSPEVLEHFRAQGPGWQTRIDEALKKWIEEHRE